MKKIEFKFDERSLESIDKLKRQGRYDFPLETFLTMDYKLLTSCLCCNSTSLLSYLDLGQQPPCNALLSSLTDSSTFYPLTANVCQKCFHSQLSISLDPDILFSNYTYRTGVSQTLKDHYKQLAKDALDYYGVMAGENHCYKNWNVLDIGCNDGTLLSYFKPYLCSTYGVDICRVDHTGVDYYFECKWKEELIDLLQQQKVSFDIICGTNVIAHNDYPKEFLNLCYRILRYTGIVVLEFPYAKDLLKHNEFDTIYHEHISYFNVNSFINLLDNTGLYIDKIIANEIHGGSIRFYLRPTSPGYERQRHKSDIVRFLLDESRTGLNDVEVYKSFQWKVDKTKASLKSVVQEQREQGRAVVGFGASGKGSVLLNYCDIDLDYIVDETPAKQGKFSPGKKIPIVGLDTLLKDKRDLSHLVLSWNCMQESLQKIWNARQGRTFTNDTVIRYIPDVSVSHLIRPPLGG